MFEEKLKLYLPLGLFFAYTTRLMVKGATFADGGILLGLAVLCVLYEYRFDRKHVEEVKEKFKELDIVREDIKVLADRMSGLKDHVSGIKLGQSITTAKNTSFTGR